jgi:hypothetical protein
MASSTPTYRLNQQILEADRATVLAVQGLADYAPRNPAFSAEQLRSLAMQLAQAEQLETSLRASLEAARAAATQAGWQMHNAVLGARAEVVVQYGDDSATVQAVGRTRRSDRKRPTRAAAR